MGQKRRLPYLLGGLILMFVALQFLTAGVSDPEQYGMYRYYALLAALIAEGALLSVFRESALPVKMVILLVSLIPLFCLVAVGFQFMNASPVPGP